MWDYAGYSEIKRKRIRETQKKRQEWLKSRAFKLRRLEAEIRPKAAWGMRTIPIRARLLSCDMSPWKATVFTARAIPLGTEMEFTCYDPLRPIYLQGKVVGIERIALDAKIVSESGAFPYRVTLKFEFKSRDEFEAAREGIEKFLSDYYLIPKSA